MSKKIVLAEIDTCKACPHAYRVCDAWTCHVAFSCRNIKKFGEPILEPDTIPDWCPLSNAGPEENLPLKPLEDQCFRELSSAKTDDALRRKISYWFGQVIAWTHKTARTT